LPAGASAAGLARRSSPGYTTLLIDGIPIFSSVSSAYGLDSVSLGGLERIDISRGAGTSLIAPEALAGSVNIVTRRPLKDELLINQQFGSYGQMNTELFGAKTFSGGGLTGNFSHNQHDTVDGDDNKVSEYTGYKRNLGGIGFFVDDIAGFKLKGRFDVVDEKRMGGAMGTDYSGVKTDGSGNPFDWSKGKNGFTRFAWLGNTGRIRRRHPEPTVRPAPSIKTAVPACQRSFSPTVSSSSPAPHANWARAACVSPSAMPNTSRIPSTRSQTYKAEQSSIIVEASTQQPLGQTLVTAGFNLSL
jgi:outer membrane receptor for ferrienterochelin and colicins